MRVTSGLLAVALAVADITSAQNSDDTTLEAELANLEQYWSYGRSPEVLPARKSPTHINSYTSY